MRFVAKTEEQNENGVRIKFLFLHQLKLRPTAKGS